MFVVLALSTTAVFATPKIDSVTVQPGQPKFSGDKPPEVEVAVSVLRTKFDKGGCDARLEFGDGESRTLDFAVASKRSVRHTYKKGGSFTLVAKGAGKTPCEGMGQMPLIVQGPPEKKAEPKKAEKKPAGKKAPAKKKPAPKKDEGK